MMKADTTRLRLADGFSVPSGEVWSMVPSRDASSPSPDVFCRLSSNLVTHIPKEERRFQGALIPEAAGPLSSCSVRSVSQFLSLVGLAQFTRLRGGLNPESSSVVMERILHRVKSEPRPLRQCCDKDPDRLGFL